MNYGRFFVLDHDTSRFHQGISVFNYRGLMDKASDRTHTPKYPIYLTISKESIDFRVHYFWEKDESLDETYTHLHNLILSLPLSANIEIKDGLTTALADSYKTTFPVTPQENEFDYLHNIIADKECIESTIINGKINSYSDLVNFNIFKGEKFILDIEVEEKKINRFIRKLILDFLFDLEHTKVFKNSPHYEYISIRLRETYFFNALANKAMFYYYRELIKEANKDNLRFYGEHLFKAEREWTKSIRNEKSETIFHESQRWSEVTSDKRENASKKNKNELIGWFKEPEAEMAKIYEERENKEKEAYNLMLGKKKDKPQEHKIAIEKDMKNDYKLSSIWYTRKGAFNHLFYKPINIFLCFLMFLPMTFLFKYIFPDSLSCVNSSFSMGISFILMAHILLTIIVFVIIWFSSKKRMFQGSHIYFPRLVIAIVTGWITIYFGTTVFSISAFDGISNNNRVIIWGITVMLLATIWFTYVEVGRLNPYIERIIRIKRTLYLILISFFYSYITGFFLFFLIKEQDLVLDWSELHLKKLFSFNSDNQLFHFEEYIHVFFLFTFFAMFIGIFLNMMIQEKRATDPL